MDQLAAMRDTISLMDERLVGYIAGNPADALREQHLHDMLRAMESGINPQDPSRSFSEAKAGRWLGWAQAAVVAMGVATLEDVKEINKRHAGGETPDPIYSWLDEDVVERAMKAFALIAHDMSPEKYDDDRAAAAKYRQGRERVRKSIHAMSAALSAAASAIERRQAAALSLQIEHMVGRFLAWRLPTDFRPDGGITFEPLRNKGTAYEAKWEPTGTNLLDAAQAEAMVRHMVEGIVLSAAVPSGPAAVPKPESETSSISKTQNVAPRHCSKCGLGAGEWMACEEPSCGDLSN